MGNHALMSEPVATMGQTLPTDNARRQCLAWLGLITGAGLHTTARALSMPAHGLDASVAPNVVLTPEQSRHFQSWFTLMVHEQVKRGPNPRWQQRDCVGLIRFAVGEALRPHTSQWRHANSLQATRLPPELELSAEQRLGLQQWQRRDGSQGAYVSAQDLVSYNARLLTKSPVLAQPGDLFYFDQGQAQHLMVWMGSYLAYHTGNFDPQDNGMRAFSLAQMAQRKDTRWHLSPYNPNFVGIFRFSFLSA
jgi:uncharacterized protein